MAPRSPGRWSAAVLAAVLTIALAGCSPAVVGGRGATGDAASGSPSPSGGSTGGSTPAGTGLRFGSCSGVDLGRSGTPSAFQVTCARLAVPLDYAHPRGPQIEIALVRLHRKGSSADRPLLINPGGPGGSGVQFAVGEAPALPNELTGTFDLVGFDPRGVGSSSPVRCLTDAQKDALNAAQPDVSTASGFVAAKRMAAQVAHACSAKYGSALADFDTVATAKDLDRMRAAFGSSRLDYLGFSYGTQLGSTYAHLFPTRIGVMVLDGAVDPITDDLTSEANQIEGFEKTFDLFAAWCAQRDPCRQLGDPRQAVYAISAGARAHPLPSGGTEGSRKVTSAVVLLAVLTGMYSQTYWSTLAESLLLAERGDGRGLQAMADVYDERDASGHYSNLSDANETISCNDAPPGPSDSTIRSTAASWAKRFPMFGLWLASSLFGCQDWQPERTVPPEPTAATSTNTILVVGNTTDPATPYQGAKDLTRILGKARLLTWQGVGHTSYLEGSSCIDGAVTDYLVHSTLPPTGKTCPR